MRLDEARSLRLRLAAARRRAGDPDALRAAAADVEEAERALTAAEARLRFLRERAQQPAERVPGR